MISDFVRDNGLAALVNDGEELVLCSQIPTTYAEANATYRLGGKTPTITLTDHTPDGRRAQCASFTDGTVTASGGSGSGMAWAVIDITNTRLLSAGDLTNDQAVVNGNQWGISAAFAVGAFRD